MDPNLILELAVKYGPALVAEIMALIHKGTPLEQDWIDFGTKVKNKTFDQFQQGRVDG